MNVTLSVVEAQQTQNESLEHDCIIFQVREKNISR